MKLSICIISIIVLALLISPAFAYSSLNGPTGTANLPNAEIAKSGLAVAFDSQSTAGGNVQSWRGAYGLGKCLEISGNYVSASRSMRGLSAKYVLNANETNMNAVGMVYGTTAAVRFGKKADLGLEDLGTRGTGESVLLDVSIMGEMLRNRVNTVQAYFAHTKILIGEGNKRPALLGTLGMNYTDESFRDGVGRAFGSLEARYQNTSIAFDYQTLNTTIENHSMRSIIVRREFQSGAGVEFGWTNALGVLGTSSSNFFFGGSFAYDLK